VPSHGKLPLVNTSGIGQHYRSGWRRNMNNLLGAKISNFFVA